MPSDKLGRCDYSDLPHSGGGTDHGPAAHRKGGYHICAKCYDAIIKAEAGEEEAYRKYERERPKPAAPLPETQPREGDDHPGPIAPLKGDTPMTDAAIERGDCGPDFARQLERGLAAKQEELLEALRQRNDEGRLRQHAERSSLSATQPIDGLIEELVIRADLPANIQAEEYFNGSDMATIGHFENWRIGIHTGQPGGDYRDTNLGDPEWTAKLIAVLLNYHANGVRPTAPVSTSGPTKPVEPNAYLDMTENRVYPTKEAAYQAGCIDSELVGLRYLHFTVTASATGERK